MEQGSNQERKDRPQTSAMCDTATEEIKGFGWALKQMSNGLSVFRQGWNGKGLFLKIQWPDFNSKMSKPYIYIHTADNQLVPWVASQGDLLATDWEKLKS